MTGATDLFEDDNLDHLFTNTTLPNVGDAAGLAYPQSGEGIRPAVESGLMAATVVLPVPVGE